MMIKERIRELDMVQVNFQVWPKVYNRPPSEIYEEINTTVKKEEGHTPIDFGEAGLAVPFLLSQLMAYSEKY